MADPSGITRRTVTVDCSTAFETSEDLGATITATSTVPSLVWAATGGRIVSDRATGTATPGAVASLDLIPCDLTGWTLGGQVVDVDPAAGKFSHAYNITIQPTRQDGPRTTAVGPPIVYTNVIVLSGTDAFDLDKAVQVGTPVQPVTLPPDLTGPQGEQGPKGDPGGNVPLVGSTPTDGQLLSYSTTLGGYTPVNPTGPEEVGYAGNITGTATNLAGVAGGPSTIVDITGAALSVGASDGRSVRIEFGATIGQQNSAGGATVFLILYETTSGNVLAATSGVRAPGIAGLTSHNITIPTGVIRIGQVSATRTFKLSAYVYSDSGSTVSLTIANTAQQPSFIRALAG